MAQLIFPCNIESAITLYLSNKTKDNQKPPVQLLLLSDSPAN